MTPDEDAVRSAIRSLNDQGLTRFASSAGSRVPKYEHRLNETFNFHRHEIAVLCVLLLRGPQTPGELRTRSERMYTFEDLESVHSALHLLMKREPPLVKVLPRQPGNKESRYVHLLSGEPVRAEADSPPKEYPGPDSSASSRVEVLEQEIAALREEIASLKQQFRDFQKQFQ